MTIETPEEAQRWIYKADMNLKSATVLISYGLYDAAYFLAQKATEMYLKAILSTKESPASTSPNLLYLLKKLVQYGYPVPLQLEQKCWATNEFMGLSLEPGCYVDEQEAVRITEYAKNFRKFSFGCLSMAPEGKGSTVDFDTHNIEGSDLYGRTLLN
jgi:HEPN domain-containing protein